MRTVNLTMISVACCLALTALHATPKAKKLDWSSVPQSFRNLMTEQTFPIAVSLGKKNLGSIQATLTNNILHIDDLLTLLSNHNIKLKPNFARYLQQQAKQGLRINQPILCHTLPATLLGQCPVGQAAMTANFSLDTMKLNLWVNPAFYQVNQVAKSHYLAAPSTDNLSDVMGYNVNFNFNQGDNNYLAELNNLLAKGNNRLYSSVYLSHSSELDTTEIDQLYYAHDRQNQLLKAGYFNNISLSGTQGSQMTYGFNGKGIVGEWKTSNHLLINKSQSSLIPVHLFFNYQSKVEVYRDKLLVSVQNFPAGANNLDTSELPTGVYPITLKIYQNGHLTSTQEKTIYKPFDSQNLTPDHYAFDVMAGVVKPLNATSFDKSYLGASYTNVYTTYLMATASAYAVGDFMVGDVQTNWQLPWSTRLNLSAGADLHSGYGANAQISKNFGSFFSGNLWYSMQGNGAAHPNLLSPFSNDIPHQYGTSVNVNLSKLGNINWSYSASTSGEMHQQNVYYYLQCYQGHGLSVSFTTGWNENQQGNQMTHDWRVGLFLNFNLDNGTNMSLNSDYDTQEHASNSQLTINPQFGPDSWIRQAGVNVDYSHEQHNIGVNAQLQRPWISGDISTTMNQGQGSRSYSTSGSLQGTLALTGTKFGASSQLNAKSGVMVDMTMPHGQHIMASINGAQYRLHDGNNFIPLSPYHAYDFFLLQDPDSNMVLKFPKTKAHFTIYPGNIKVLHRDALSLIQISGQLMQHGKPMPHVKISNHVNAGYTDSNGFFVININRAIPTLRAFDKQGQVMCRFAFDQHAFDKAQPGKWVGVLNCAGNKKGVVQ